jgi:DNA-binding transcriptional regulator YdaS (Cro superfamily)
MKKSQAINYFGGVVKLAATLTVSHSSVSQWGEVIPEKQALKLERITNGKLKYDPSLYCDVA